MNYKEMFVWICALVLIGFTFHTIRGCTRENGVYLQNIKKIEKDCDKNEVK